MLYVEDASATEKSFLSLLEETRIRALREIQDGRQVKNGIDFQEFVFYSMCEAAQGTDFHGTVRQSGPHAFPDIIAKKYFGVEVKLSLSDKWTSLGNSILESTREDDVEKIYMLFGRIGKSADIRYRRYQDCLKSVSVTHSPRYLIDMDLPEGQSIFTDIGVDYDTLRKEANPISIIKNFYRSQLREGEELWWIDQSQDQAVSPIIRPFRSLTSDQKKKFVLESMILFPEIFSPSTVKFERTAAYLITRFNAVSANLRDVFTAGGQVAIEIHNHRITVPQIYGKLFLSARAIEDVFSSISDADLLYYWRTQGLGVKKLDQWKNILDEKGIGIFEDLTPSAIFEEGLKYAKITQQT